MILIWLLVAVVFIVIATTRFRLHPFMALITAALLFGLVSGMPLPLLVASINEGFGGTMTSIGLVIILGVMMGTFLEKSGGVYALATSLLRMLGPKLVYLGMALLGYVVSIPVFADSGYVILTPLNKAITRKAGLSLVATATALAMGLLASHAMVPPTPGPIAAAGILDADLGMVIFWGLIVSSVSLLPILLFVKYHAAKFHLEMEEPPETEQDALFEDRLPGVGLSIMPILVPILCIVFKSFNTYFGWFEQGNIKGLIDFVGSPVIALLIGFSLSLLLPRRLKQSMFAIDGWVGAALKDAAIILMITGAGGVFGKTLQNSSLAAVIEEVLGGVPLGILLPFLIAAALKTAQGSSTVAMITTASIVSPIMVQLGLSAELPRALTVLAIGAGSAVVSHANDSYFWVVTQFTGMNVSLGYRLHTVATAILGISAMLMVYLLSLILA